MPGAAYMGVPSIGPTASPRACWCPPAAATCPCASPLHGTHEAGDLLGVDVLRCVSEGCWGVSPTESMSACQGENVVRM